MVNNINNSPVELFHTIFDYLSAYEILRAFHDLNDYLHSVLKSYPHFKLDFQSIGKSRFDLICEYVQPSSIKALRLSDYPNETAGQCELFLSLINIDRMGNLQVLSLIQIEDVPLATHQTIGRFLRQTPNLVHLDLSANVREEFADGTYSSHFICKCLHRLSTFHFYFNFDSSLDEHDLNTFRSSFWLEWKRWYIAWDGRHRLYTLANRYFHYDDISSDLKTTCPEGLTLLCNTATYLVGSTAYDKFSNIHTLEMDNFCNRWDIDSYIDPRFMYVHRILHYRTARHIICSRVMSWKALLDIYQPNLSELTLQSLSQYKRYFSLDSIRRLDIHQVDNIAQIYSIFPSFENLKISVYGQTEIVYILNRLKYLCTTEFYYDGKNRISIEWICKNAHLPEDNFTYRIDEQSYILYMWINNQSKEHAVSSNIFTCCYSWLRKKNLRIIGIPWRWTPFPTLCECSFKPGLFATTPLKDEAFLRPCAAYKLP